MAKRAPVNLPAPRVIHYIDPAPPANTDLTVLGPAGLAARQAQERHLYLRWVARRAAIAERDRKVRRFWLGFGAIVGTGVLAGTAGLVWAVWHAVTAAGLGLLAIPLILLGLGGLVLGGHRCITVIQHWH